MPDDWYDQCADVRLTNENMINIQGSKVAPLETNYVFALNRLHHVAGVSPQKIRAFRPKQFREELDEGELRILVIETDKYGAATLDIAAMSHAYLAFINKAAKEILDIL